MISDLEFIELIGSSDYVVLTWHYNCYTVTSDTPGCVKYLYKVCNFDNVRFVFDSFNWSVKFHEGSVEDVADACQ
jgi:hypothetical protein